MSQRRALLFSLIGLVACDRSSVGTSGDGPDIQKPPENGEVDEWIEKAIRSAGELGSPKLKVTPIGPSGSGLQAEWERLRQSPSVAAMLKDHRHALLHIKALRSARKDGAKVSERAYQAVVFDYVANKTLIFEAELGTPEPTRVEVRDDQPLPSQAEYREAEAILSRNPALAAAVRAGHMHVTHPMPPLLPGALERTVFLGLSPTPAGREAGLTRGFAGVNLNRQKVVGRNKDLLDPTAMEKPQALMMAETSSTCEAPDGELNDRDFDGAQSAHISWGNWEFDVIRPYASSPSSSPASGGGLELQNVYWKGKKVLTQAHTPILNVKYHNGFLCNTEANTYRDQTNAESLFQAPYVGNGVLHGGTEAATTIIESNVDEGHWNGVYMWEFPGTLEVVTEMRAGHYRYGARWVFLASGLLIPGFGFSAIENSCTCEPHTHHVYWRLDFDVNGASGNVMHKTTNDGQSWALFGNGYEAKDYRQLPNDPNFNNYYYRITGSGGNRVLLKPSVDDQSTRSTNPNPNVRQGTYADGDVWGLLYNGSELHDGQMGGPEAATKAKIDQWRSSWVSINSKDVVVWYGAHRLHEADNHTGVGTYAGPLIIASW